MHKFFVKRPTYSDTAEMAASAACGGKHDLLKGLNIVSKSMSREIYCRRVYWGRGE